MSTLDVFKFGLYLNNQPIIEEIFDKTYLPREINLKNVANEYIKLFKNTLSLRNENITTDSYFKTYNKLAKFYKLEDNDNITKRNNSGFINEEGYYQNDNENFKFILFNIQGTEKNIVIERNFAIKNYNPNTRFSYELLETFQEVLGKIKDELKQKDIESLYQFFESRNYYKEPTVQTTEQVA